MKALRKALCEAYPFGQKAYHPYKIWCDEIKFQLGLKPAKVPPHERQPDPLPGQKELF